MTTGADEIRAVLSAYRLVMGASWPELHPAMAARSAGWAQASEAELRVELADYLAEASLPSSRVRVFWKLLPDLKFGGCNEHFATDAGVPSAELKRLDDFDKRLPWGHQAAKYRTDDRDVAESGTAKLDIVERQESAAGITWVRVGKAPIRTAQGKVIGILGMYERLDPETGRKLFLERGLTQRPRRG